MPSFRRFHFHCGEDTHKRTQPRQKRSDGLETIAIALISVAHGDFSFNEANGRRSLQADLNRYSLELHGCTSYVLELRVLCASMRAIKPVCAAWTTVSHFLAMFDPASDSEGHDAYERQLAPNPSLSLLRHARADVLRRTLNEAVPYCCGTLRPTSSSLVLYYGKSEQARRIDLLRASTTALSELEKYCDPATFGVSQKDVLDLAYRKAGKLDRDHFAFNFDLERSGVLDIVRMGLFTGKSQRQLSGLIAPGSGKGCFFKSHKDTPRSTAMFASLVLIFPTAHSGGELLMEHGGRKWSFDSATVLSDTNESEPRLAYIAFFSDVEHEVTRVTSGHRLSITYNLYYAYDDIPMDRLEVIQPKGANTSEVHGLLESLLDDPTFLPNGGILGFGLRHLYPLPTHFDAHDDKMRAEIAKAVNGSLAVLSFPQLNPPQLKAVLRVLARSIPPRQPKTQAQIGRREEGCRGGLRSRQETQEAAANAHTRPQAVGRSHRRPPLQG
ncbi:hypothetical protein NUW54_g10008 [Trametes sanguinea]|uniref:Uncharacterized protein n=1 Tax=Trametes sanguinea TaxID=158606 RepID=A0ACC1P3G2_9APHY|nr:hypothetical protein NUW54_g10008 [Trametes sanguinea]